MRVRNAESAALDRAHLKKSFSEVPVGLKLLDGPLHPTNRAIFQMSISRSRRFGEYFQIWTGARDNEVEVLSADPSLLQLVRKRSRIGVGGDAIDGGAARVGSKALFPQPGRQGGDV